MSEQSTAPTIGLLQPGQVIKPIIDEDEVPDLVKKLYDLKIKTIKELKSYDDKNFLIQVEPIGPDHYMTELWPHGYILKIVNSMDTKDPDLLDGQHQLMLHLYSRGFKVPFPIKNKNGRLMEKETISIKENVLKNESTVCTIDSSEHMVRLLTFIPGKTLFDVPYTTQLFYQCGAYIANMNNELKNFHHETISKRNFLWMLSSTLQLRKFLYAVRDEERNNLIKEVLSAWETKVEPIMSSLESGVIHGDFNEQNILVNDDSDGVYHVTGVIDFGDISKNAYVFEVAICIMYLMIEVTVIHPNAVGGHMLAGYYTKRTLSNLEWSVLKVCVAARFAQSLVLGAYSYEQDPGNEYVLTTAAKGWQILSDFWNTPDNEIISRWKSTMQTYKVNIS